MHNLCSENLCGSDARFQRTASLCSSGCRLSGVLCGRSALFRGIALPSRSRAAGVRGEARGHLLAITAAVLVGSAPGTVAWSDQAVLVASQCLPPVLQRVEGGGCISCCVSCLAVTCLVLSSCLFVLRRSTRWRVKPRILACVRRMSYARGACTCPA